MAMSSRAVGLLVVAGIVGFVVTFGALAFWLVPGRCIPEEPRRVTGGAVWSDGGGIFSPPIEVYYAFDAGKREDSGEACGKRRRVTEREYERLFYGRKD